MDSKIKIFETTMFDGVMSRNKKFYSNNLTQEEINTIFLNTRLKLGKKYEFNGKKIIQAMQKNENNNLNYEDGKYIEITNEHLKKDDYWYEQLPADILILKEQFKNVVVGNQTSDCPILIIEDRKLGITAISHCGGAYIDRLLPKQTIEVLLNKYASNINNLYIYIGTCAKKDNYIYETYPRWAKNDNVWKTNIKKTKSGYSIDLVNAMLIQFKNIKSDHITISSNDTITNRNYSSHYCSCKNMKEKEGQNFVGFYYL